MVKVCAFFFPLVPPAGFFAATAGAITVKQSCQTAGLREREREREKESRRWRVWRRKREKRRSSKP
jgi:hypothetical protein